MSRRTKIFLLVVVVVGACAFGVYVLILGFTEDLYFKKWSIAHVLFTPSFIEHLPRPQIIGEVVYYHSSGDGPKPMAEGLSFETTASRDEILNQFNEYLAQNGYIRDAGAADFLDYQYSKNGNKFYFAVQSLGGGKNRVVAQECYFS
jgi:hypothetical protein